MKRMDEDTLAYLDARFAWAFDIEGFNTPEKRAVQLKMETIKVTLRFPMGELLNPNITGFVWAWNMQGKIVTDSIKDTDRFNAQGIEGCIQVNKVSLTTALLVARELEPNRLNIWYNKKDIEEV